MHTHDQESVIKDLVDDHGDAEVSPYGEGLLVNCEDGFSCFLDANGAMSHRRDNTATRVGLGWPE